MKLKYILTKEGTFVIFHPTTAHNQMAKGLWGTPISAGFCYLDTLNDETKPMTGISVRCSGESISMKLKSRPEDSEIITNKINDPYQ